MNQDGIKGIQNIKSLLDLDGITIAYTPILPYISHYSACSLETKNEVTIKESINAIHDRGLNIFYVSKQLFEKLKTETQS